MSELKDRYEEITNNLQKRANDNMAEEIRQSQAYNQGYIQACEDYLKELKLDLLLGKEEPSMAAGQLMCDVAQKGERR